MQLNAQASYQCRASLLMRRQSKILILLAVLRTACPVAKARRRRCPGAQGCQQRLQCSGQSDLQRQWVTVCRGLVTASPQHGADLQHQAGCTFFKTIASTRHSSNSAIIAPALAVAACIPLLACQGACAKLTVA